MKDELALDHKAKDETAKKKKRELIRYTINEKGWGIEKERTSYDSFEVDAKGIKVPL